MKLTSMHTKRSGQNGQPVHRYRFLPLAGRRELSETWEGTVRLACHRQANGSVVAAAVVSEEPEEDTPTAWLRRAWLHLSSVAG
jgi:hypothetical protein